MPGAVTALDQMQISIKRGVCWPALPIWPSNLAGQVRHTGWRTAQGLTWCPAAAWGMSPTPHHRRTS